MTKSTITERSLLLSDIREYLGRGQSLYSALLREGVSKSLAAEVLSVVNAREVEQEDSPMSIEVAGITATLLHPNE